MLHELLKTWFTWVHDWGYAGVTLLMAMESSIIPVPSEVVMPPAAFWAAQGKLDFWGVVAAGTVGSYLGSAVSYWISRWVGAPLVARWGKYFLLPPAKVERAHVWIERFGMGGIFFARLLPVIRHLISIPAGILRMPFGGFSLATTLGAGLWCGILSWFGERILGGRPELLESPVAMVRVIREQFTWFIAGVLVLGVLYGVVVVLTSRGTTPARRRRPA